MNDSISGVAGKIFQQIADNQASASQSPKGRSFESYMQQDERGKTSTDQSKPSTVEQPQPLPADDPQKAMQILRDRLEELNRGANAIQNNSVDFNKMMKDIMNPQTRMSMLDEARSQAADTSKVTSDLSGRFIQVENEYKSVEAIMNSGQNLSSGQLLALQARLYQVGQHIEVMSKVVDQMAGGIKTVLNTNV